MHEIKDVAGLLRKVDENETRAAVSVAVDVPRCRQRAARRRTARRAVAGSLAAVLLTSACLLFQGTMRTGWNDENEKVARRAGDRTSGGTLVIDGGSTDGYSNAMRDTQYEAQMIEDTIELYQARQRLAWLQSRLANLETHHASLSQVRLTEEIHITAAITLNYADRLAKEVNEPALATAEYRRIVQSYPGTSWAASAAAALAQMQ